MKVPILIVQIFDFLLVVVLDVLLVVLEKPKFRFIQVVQNISAEFLHVRPDTLPPGVLLHSESSMRPNI
jgi:hypothetical protein